MTRSLALLLLACSLAAAQLEPAYHVRHQWGDDALWGYWEFDRDYLSPRGWKVLGNQADAARLIDGDPATAWYPTGQDAYELTVDLGRSQALGAATLLDLNRPVGQRDSLPGQVTIWVHDAAETRGEPVVSTAYAGAMGRETVMVFAKPATGRLVTLRVQPRTAGNDDKGVCLRELSLVPPDAVAKWQAAKAEAAAGRARRWAERDAEASTEVLAKDFFSRLFATDAELNAANLRLRDKLAAAGKLKSAGRYLDSLRAFREYYFDKLRRPEVFGYHAADVHPYGSGSAGQGGFPESPLDRNLDADGLRGQVEAADELLKGNMKLGGKLVAIGEPGSVDWDAPGPPYGWMAPGGVQQPWLELNHGTGFLPLFRAFWVTKDAKYLRRWVDYLDDWALNAHWLAQLDPIDNHDNSRFPDVMTIRAFAGAALALPLGSDAVPPQAFARIMRRLSDDSVLNDIVYYRSAQMGWVPGTGRMLLPMLIDEFKVAPIYFRETRRRNIEDLNTVQTMRDGTEPHQWPGYNWLGLLNTTALTLMEQRENLPPWAQPVWEQELHTPEWRRELLESLSPRALYQLHWVTPIGQYPLTTHHQPPALKGKMRETFRFFPQALDDPPTARLYSTLYGDGSAGKPEWTADWFPYGGYAIARTGWGWGEGYGSMFCSPQPGLGSVGSQCKNNAFSLNMYGADLLDDDLVHTWIGFHNTSPVNVDGKRQWFSFNKYTSRWPSLHKGEMATAWDEPAPWRWSSSAHFDLIEGVYAGPYSNDKRNRTDVVTDVKHQRQALFARHAGLWVLTDRLLSPAAHGYEQTWFFPLRRNDKIGFAPAEIVPDAATRTIKTRRTHTYTDWSYDAMAHVVVPNTNVSLYQFSDAALSYAAETKQDDAESYGFQIVRGSWKGTGDQQVVTAVFPRKPTPVDAKATGNENDLSRIERLDTPTANGFRAVTPEGDRVSYLAAKARGGAELTLDGITLVGEALLTETDRDDRDLRGVALEARSLHIGGTTAAPAQADFEFALPPGGDAAALRVNPIYRPISPVRILPESDVFIDHQPVTLACATPGVFLTYTLDGSDPTPQSTRYTQPFTLDRSAVVKARAYRPGTERNPPQTSGTHATPTSFARYDKRPASLTVDQGPHQPGLTCEYFEDFWKEMWLRLDGLKPRRQAVVPELFDLSVLPDDNRPIGDARVPCEKPYGLRYSGYLKVPTEGVYTFHAPREFVVNDTVAGYELKLWVSRATILDDGRLRRDNDLAFWYPATRRHGLGTWSVPLTAGFHEFKVVYIDFRTDGAQRLNQPAPMQEYVWSGLKPDLRLSGPGLATPQAVPAGWLYH